MKPITLTKDQALGRYGDDFVRFMMRGKKEITIGPKQQALLEKWKMMKELRFAPFAYEYVYIVANGDAEFKIGFTVAPQKRLGQLKSASTNDLRIVGIIVTGWQHGRNIERALISEYKRRGLHIRGEWFKGDADAEIPSIRDFVVSRYANNITTLKEAYDGCEPLVDLYVAANKNQRAAVDVLEYRRGFMWLVGQVESGDLTVLS